jgi:hypothetical protein
MRKVMTRAAMAVLMTIADAVFAAASRRVVNCVHETERS